MGTRSAEFPFMRTLRKPVEATKPTIDPIAPKLKNSSLESLTKPVRTKYTLPPLDTPILRGNAELSSENPVFRLDKLQSGIGSMKIENAEAVVWEMHDLLSGFQLDTGKVTALEPPIINNRSIVGWENGDLFVNLRHGHKIRRLIVASFNQGLYVKFYDGSMVFCPMSEGKNALSITRIGQEFELRLETVQSVNLMDEFGVIPSNVMTDTF